MLQIKRLCSSPAIFPALLFICLSTAYLVNASPAKLRIPSTLTGVPSLAQGSRILADYGSFQMVEAEEAEAARLLTAGAEPAEDSNIIELNAQRLDTRSPAVQALRRSLPFFGGKRLHLVQFVGPIKPEWRDELEFTGVQVVDYIPQNTYLVRGDADALARLQVWAASSSTVQWEGTYADQYKIHPRARATDKQGRALAPETDLFAIQLVEDAGSNPATLALIDRLKLEPVRQRFQTLNYLNVKVRLPPERLSEIAAEPDVISIQPQFPRHKMDERQDQILAGNVAGNSPSGPGYLAWLLGRGFLQSQFDASSLVVDLSDSGIDNGTVSPGHFGLYQSGDPNLASRVVYARLEGTPNPGSTIQGCDGHGNLNAHILAGFNDRNTGFPHQDASSYRYGLGVCPFVKVGSSVIFDSDAFTDPNYANLAARAYRDGARISNNSWGADTFGAYDSDAQAYDALVRDAQPLGSAVAAAGNQQLVIVFAGGNAGPDSGTVGSPGTAKNVMVVGAAENVRSLSTANGGSSSLGNDGCSTPDSEANSADDILSYSSRGPCADGRQKPDLVAPGSHITGGVAQNSTSTNGSGSALTCYTGSGVCTLPGGGFAGSPENFFPLNQEFYTVSSGTSHAVPAVSGACALLRQYFINHSLPPPSPAMTKAFLANSARYLTGSDAGDTLPSPAQGMGEVNLGRAFDGVARVLRDQVDKFTASGQTRTISGAIADPSKPFRVTLAWTDAPGSTTGSAYKNDLNLVVTVGGNTYKGNVFSGGVSVAGGIADGKNNLESIFLPAGSAGPFVVTVTAANLNSDGVPNEAPVVDQDFALVIYNGQEALGPVISADSFSLVTEGCLPANGAIDPGEAVTVGMALRNIGSVNATNVIATLLNAGGVTGSSGAKNYGTLLAGGLAVTQAFTFSANGFCGSNLVAQLALMEASTNLGNVSFTIPLGQYGPIFTQGFDAVAPPALPAGWTTSASGAQGVWSTATAQVDSAPNAAFSPDPENVGVNELVSPVIPILSGSAQISFRHSYDLETDWDGGVLEIKIGSGAFTDIVAAGGTFLLGGYNNTLSASSNPLSERSAWSGNSGGFVTTTIDLPATVAGQNVQFRWRGGGDDSTGGGGWYVDSVVVSARVCCGGATFTQPSIQAEGWALRTESCQATNGAIDPGETVSVDLVLKNIGTGNATNVLATLLPGGGVSEVSPPQNYGAMGVGGGTVSRPFSFFASGACGSLLTATLQLQDGDRELGQADFTITLGRAINAFTQNFDGVSPPSLPAGWVTSSSGGQSPWTTTSGSSETTPNAAFSAEGTTAGVNELISPSFVLPAGVSQLIFRNSYDLEAGSTSAYDGGVLEIKMGAGNWTDIIAAGGSFIAAGYNYTISSGFSNPLGGRQAWSGSSVDYLTTIVQLPPSAAGQSIQLRWRCATDSSSALSGWWVDSISVVSRVCCGDIVPPVVIAGPTNQSVLLGSSVSFVVSATGTPPLAYQWRLQGTNLPGATTSAYSKANVQPVDAGKYSVVVSNMAGTATSQEATLTVTDPNTPSILARWDFNSPTPDGNPSTGVLTPAIGSGAALMVGGATGGFAAGTGNDPNNTDNSGLNTTTYPSQGAGNKTRGVQFKVSTVGWQNIAVTFDEQVSTNASKYVRLQYSTNGSTYADYSMANAMGAASGYESKSNSLAALPGVNNNPAFSLRLLSEFESTAAGTANANYVTASGETYSTSGSIRYDLVTVWGTPIPPPPPLILLNALNISPAGQVQLNLAGTGGYLWVVQASSNLSNWISLATNPVPFTFVETNTPDTHQRYYRARLWP